MDCHSFSRGSCPPRDQTHISCIDCGFFSTETLEKPCFFVCASKQASRDWPTTTVFFLSFFVFIILFYFIPHSLVLCSLQGTGSVWWERKATSGLPARQVARVEAGGKDSRLRSPASCAVPECSEHNFQHTLSLEELSGSQPACKAQGQAATMTVSIQENLGEPEEVRQVEWQLVSSAELSARHCGFVDGRGSPDCWEGLIYWSTRCAQGPATKQQKEKGRKKKNLTADQWDQVLREHFSWRPNLLHRCLLAGITSYSKMLLFQTTFGVQSAGTKWLWWKAINKQVMSN